MTDEADEALTESEVRIRRAPRYVRFLIVGAMLGVIAALAGTSLFPVDPAVGFGATFGYLALYGIPIGLAVGAFVAVLLDHRATGRAATVVAGKMSVQAPSGEQNPAQHTSGAQDVSEAQPESDDGQG
jgi:hypothetical protein